MTYTVNDAINRADERCRRDNAVYVVLEDPDTGDLFVQAYEARRPPHAKIIHESWPRGLS
jgi:hypothetical protein